MAEGKPFRLATSRGERKRIWKQRRQKRDDDQWMLMFIFDRGMKGTTQPSNENILGPILGEYSHLRKESFIILRSAAACPATSAPLSPLLRPPLRAP